MQTENKTISLILGGGAGTRLFPLTSHRSKPAVPIAGKYRIIDIPISNCINSGLYRMFVLTQYNSASLNAHIKNTYHFDLFSNGFVEILAAEQTPTSSSWYQGTADAVRQSMHHLANFDHDYVLILSGDQLYQMNLQEIIDHHIESKADVTLGTIPVVAEDAPGFGIMKVNDDGFIESWIEKPSMDLLGDWQSPVAPEYAKKGKHYLASMGIYMFNRSFLEKLFADLPDATDFGKEFLPTAIEGGSKVASYPYGGYWTDIGTIGSFFEANIALAEPMPEFNLFSREFAIYTHPRLLAPAKIFGTFLNQALLAEGCIVHAKAIEHSVIGIRARIGKGTEISNCIVMGADYYEPIDRILALNADPNNAPIGIGENCRISQAIIDKDCRIGNDVVIKGHDSLPEEEGETYHIKDGIVVLKKKSYIPDGTRIGYKK